MLGILNSIRMFEGAYNFYYLIVHNRWHVLYIIGFLYNYYSNYLKQFYLLSRILIIDKVKE